MTRNINPRHAFAEPDAYNKARHHCHLYIQVTLANHFLPNKLPHPNNITVAFLADVKAQFTKEKMPTCDVLHGRQMCSVDFNAWLRDQQAPELAANNYSSEYESEADMMDRLTEVELPGYPSEARRFDSSQPQYGAHPSSGFGENYP